MTRCWRTGPRWFCSRFSAFCLGPLCEELAFPRIPDAAAGALPRPAVGILATAALFGAMHAPEYHEAWQYARAHRLAGARLRLVRYSTGSTGSSAFMHLASILTQFVALWTRASTHSMIETIQWTDAGVVMIDQTRLPREEVYVTCTSYQQVADAIRSMVIRGAPAIGVAAAMGVALGMQSAQTDRRVRANLATLAATRPTAVNLFWAIDRMRAYTATLRGRPSGEVREALVAEAKQIRLEDIAINECIGSNGAPLMPDGKTV